MPKALCLIGLVFSALVFLIFLLDMILGLIGSDFAPLMRASLLWVIIFMVAAGSLAYVSWTTYKEQR